MAWLNVAAGEAMSLGKSLFSFPGRSGALARRGADSSMLLRGLWPRGVRRALLCRFHFPRCTYPPAQKGRVLPEPQPPHEPSA